ncbi:hypothetical protein ACOSQ2_032244 [Xanthoceras sorbifolium]
MVFVRHCWLCRATRRNSRATTSKAGSVVDSLRLKLCCDLLFPLGCVVFFCVKLDFLPPRSSNDHLERGIWSSRPPSD